jgi:hypothetical protein
MELVKREIDGHTYEFERFGAKKSLRTFAKITKLIGEPVLMAISSAKGKNILKSEIDPEILGKAIAAFTMRLDSDETMELIEELTARENVMCDGKKISFDSHYADREDHMMKVLATALEVQYRNFYRGIVGMLPGVPAGLTQARAT